MSERKPQVSDRIYTSTLDVFGTVLEIHAADGMATIECEEPLLGQKYRVVVDDTMRLARPGE